MTLKNDKLSCGYFSLVRSVPGALSLPDGEGLVPCVALGLGCCWWLALQSEATYAGQKDGLLVSRGLPESPVTRTVCPCLALELAGHRDTAPGAQFRLVPHAVLPLVSLDVRLLY